jgi:hypothetical protein
MRDLMVLSHPKSLSREGNAPEWNTPIAGSTVCCKSVKV